MRVIHCVSVSLKIPTAVSLFLLSSLPVLFCVFFFCMFFLSVCCPHSLHCTVVTSSFFFVHCWSIHYWHSIWNNITERLSWCAKAAQARQENILLVLWKQVSKVQTLTVSKQRHSVLTRERSIGIDPSRGGCEQKVNPLLSGISSFCDITKGCHSPY